MLIIVDTHQQLVITKYLLGCHAAHLLHSHAHELGVVHGWQMLVVATTMQYAFAPIFAQLVRTDVPQSPVCFCMNVCRSVLGYSNVVY